MASIYFAHPSHLSSRPQTEGAAATEAEWRDPDSASSAMQIQGVLPRLHGPTPRGTRFRDQKFGWNSLNQPDSAPHVGISPLALSRFAPSWSVEMTDIGSSGEPSILTTLLMASSHIPGFFCGMEMSKGITL